MKPIFFTASLEGNIPTLQISIPIINKYYKSPDFFIICPQNTIPTFTAALEQFTNVQLVNEEDLISFGAFEKLAQDAGTVLTSTSVSFERLGWYYQQALKLSFLFNLQSSKLPAVMWDADSIPLTRINFFNNRTNRSIVYGSRSEFNTPYFATLRNIFPALPHRFYAATIQFFSCTAQERIVLLDRTRKNYPLASDENSATWISKLVIHSVLKTHGNFCGSYFSEQEFVNLSNMLIEPSSKQIPLKHLRWGIGGRLSKSQMLLAKLFNFGHLTYENPAQTLAKKQAWPSFIQLLITETRHFNR